MKFWAKVNLEEHERENAAYLLVRFFEEFNPESSICFKGKEAILEIVFDEPPQGIIKALSCFSDGNLEFCYGKNPEEYKNGPSSDTSKQGKEEADETRYKPEKEEKGNAKIPAESSELKEPKKTVRKSEGAEKPKVKHSRSISDADMPDLSEFAQKATSYQDFYQNIAKWLDMKKKHTIFIQLILAAGEVEEIVWKNIDEILTTRGVPYKQYDRIWIGQKINEKFKETGKHVTTLPFLKAIVSYKDFEFQNESSKNPNDVNSEEVPAKAIPEEIPEDVEVISEDVPETTEKFSDEPTESENSTPKARVRMKCMMGENLEFEEVLGSVDKTVPVEERVKYVLAAMGWTEDENNKVHQQIFKIANAAVRLSKMEFDVIYSRADIPDYEQAEARMQFSKFINNFLIKEPYHGFKVHVSEFLRELQSIIMLESEL